MADKRTVTVTLTMAVQGPHNLHRGTSRERLQEAARVFVSHAEELGVPLDRDGVTMKVSYDRHVFGYEESLSGMKTVLETGFGSPKDSRDPAV